MNNPEAQMVRAVQQHQAMLNITFDGENADLPDPIHVDTPDHQIRTWATEAVRGGFHGMAARPTADFTDYVVSRHPPTEARPWNLVVLRPKTAYGVGA